MQAKVQHILIEIDNIFLNALKILKNFDSTDYNQFNFAIDIFENSDANQKIKIKFNEILDQEKNFWKVITLIKDVRENGSMYEELRKCYKNTVEMLHEFSKGQFKIPKELLSNIKFVFYLKKSHLEIIKNFADGVQFMNIDDRIKSVAEKIEMFPQLNVFKETVHFWEYLKLLQFELKCMKELLILIKAFQNMGFMNCLVSLTNYKKSIEDLIEKNTILLEQDKVTNLELIKWHNYSHAHFTSKLWLYFKECLDTKFSNSNKTRSPLLLVELLDKFEAAHPDSHIYVLSESVDLYNPFRSLSLDSEKQNFKFIVKASKYFLLYGKYEESKDSPFNIILNMIEESQELLSSYLDKSFETRINGNFLNFFLGKIDNKVYLGMVIKNCRGNKFRSCMNKVLNLMEILRNNQIHLLNEYHIAFENQQKVYMQL